jgi:hypothetical protein
MPRRFLRIPAIYDLQILLSTKSETVLQKENFVELETLDPVEVELQQPSIHAAPIKSNLIWEGLKSPGNSTLFAVAGPKASWLGVYRVLHPLPSPKKASDDLRIVTYLGGGDPGKDGYPDHEKSLKSLLYHPKHFKYEQAGRSRESLTSVLAEGADALIILAHGDRGSGIRTGSKNNDVIAASELSDALRASAASGRPLRFLLVFACEQHEDFLQLLQGLASEGALHPDFAGVLFWDKPKIPFGKEFIPHLLEELTREDDPRPFLEAVWSARVASSKEHANLAVFPIAVAFHAQPNPLPTAQELELERYLWELIELPETGFGV